MSTGAKMLGIEAGYLLPYIYDVKNELTCTIIPPRDIVVCGKTLICLCQKMLARHSKWPPFQASCGSTELIRCSAKKKTANTSKYYSF